MYDVISFGSATEDIFVDTELHEIIKKKRHFIGYPAGSKLLVKEINFFTGGGGSNTSVSFARLGLKTGYIGKLSDDITSKKILDEFKKECVDSFGRVIKNEKGSCSIVLDSLEHHRTILIYKGVNDELDFSEINKRFKTKWLYFSSMLGKSFEAQKKLAKFASLNGIKIAYNPSEYQARKGIRFLADIIRRTEILILNKEEAKLLLGFKEDANISIKELALKISERGPKIVCITDEDKGAYCLNLYENKFYYIYPHNIKVIERTGAGDAFASGFVAGIIKGKDTEFALNLAGANAESVIRQYGAKNILLRWDEAVKAIRKNPFKIRIENLK
nr:ADP-dependent ribose-1-phosphate kinase [uncultured archaeon]